MFGLEIVLICLYNNNNNNNNMKLCLGCVAIVVVSFCLRRWSQYTVPFPPARYGWGGGSPPPRSNYFESGGVENALLVLVSPC